MIVRAAACSVPALAALLVWAAPVRAQTPSASAEPIFPVTGKICWFDRRGEEAGIAGVVARAGGTPAQQAKLKDDSVRAMLRALGQSAIAAQCSVVLKVPPKAPALRAAGQDLQPEVLRLMQNNAARGDTFTGAPSSGICIVSDASVKSLTLGHEQALLDAAMVAVKQVADELRCGALFDQAAEILPNRSVNITGPAMARVMGARPACTPGVIDSGYWAGRRCIAVGGKWQGAIAARGEQKLVFRGVAGQRVRLTATRGNKGAESRCVPRIERLTGPYWDSEVTPAGEAREASFTSNSAEFVLPHTTDYAATLACHYDLGLSTESQNLLGVSISAVGR